MEKVNYGGWPNCIKMTNGKMELIVTTDVGPRVIRLGFVGGQNLMYEAPDELRPHRRGEVRRLRRAPLLARAGGRPEELPAGQLPRRLPHEGLDAQAHAPRGAGDGHRA